MGELYEFVTFRSDLKFKFWYWSTVKQHRDNIAAEVSARPESKRV